MVYLQTSAWEGLLLLKTRTRAHLWVNRWWIYSVAVAQEYATIESEKEEGLGSTCWQQDHWSTHPWECLLMWHWRRPQLHLCSDCSRCEPQNYETTEEDEQEYRPLVTWQDLPHIHENIFIAMMAIIDCTACITPVIGWEHWAYVPNLTLLRPVTWSNFSEMCH